MTAYSVIYADPPWKFATYSERGKGRSAEAHYDCMSLADIKAFGAELPVADDCVLLLWAIDPLLNRAFEVIDAWGFTYKTVGFYWVKTSKDGTRYPISTGYYTRANPETCLLATRGRPKRLSCSVRKLIVAPRREHSRKPDEAYERIEQLFGGPYLELFSRLPREGWEQHGNERVIGRRRWRSDMKDV